MPLASPRRAVAAPRKLLTDMEIRKLRWRLILEATRPTVTYATGKMDRESHHLVAIGGTPGRLPKAQRATLAKTSNKNKKCRTIELRRRMWADLLQVLYVIANTAALA